MRWWWEYRQQVSILWPSAYKAITIRQFGLQWMKSCYRQTVFLDALPLSYIGEMGGLLKVPWCTGAMVMIIPAVGFDPTSSELWALRASSAPCRWNGVAQSALMHWCDGDDKSPRQVSILWPSAYEAITIRQFGLQWMKSCYRQTVFWDALPLSYKGLNFKLCLNDGCIFQMRKFSIYLIGFNVQS